MRSSALAVGAKQVIQLAFGLVLARVLGPQHYGILAEATVYVTLTALILDQGMSSSLVQCKVVPPGAPAALATVNLLSGALLATLTWVAAPVVAAFFDTPELTAVLRLLGLGLLLKALAITPRALLSRHLRFTELARADVVGSVAGAAAGLVALGVGADHYALVVQVVVTDLVTLTAIRQVLAATRPSWRLSPLRELLPFGVKVFGVNVLAYCSANADSVLIGRFLGAADLGFYSIAYRVLVIPVLLLGQTMNRVLFPLFSRIAGDRDEVARILIAATEALAVIAIPTMSLIACAAPDLVMLGLGPEWSPAAVLVSVLALAGARESIFFISAALMRGLDHAGMNLRFQVVSTGVQLAGVVIGLQFGVRGVAVGYAVAGLVLSPMLLSIQRRLSGVTSRQQWAAIWPALHVSAWASLGYQTVAWTLSSRAQTLLLGSAVFAIVLLTLLTLVHRGLGLRTRSRLLRIRCAR